MEDEASSFKIVKRLTTLFPSAMLEEHAEELGVVEQDQKHQIRSLVWAFVFGFAAGESRTLAVFRRSYNSIADKTFSLMVVLSAVNPRLAEFLCDLVEQCLDEVAVPHTISEEFDRFREIIIADETILRLHEFQPQKGAGWSSAPPSP